MVNGFDVPLDGKFIDDAESIRGEIVVQHHHAHGP